MAESLACCWASRAHPPSRRVVDGQTKVVQVAARVPNRLVGSNLEGPPPGAYQSGLPQQSVPPPRSAASYPSLLLAEKQEEEKTKASDLRRNAEAAKARSSAISAAVGAGIKGGSSGFPGRRRGV